MSLFQELKRRNVFRVGIAYVLMGWVLLQGADFVLDLIGVPDWVIRALAVVVVIGLPIALFFAWAFELTPEGIKREAEVDRAASIAPKTAHRLDRLIILVLAGVVVWFLFDEFYLEPREDAVRASAQAGAAGTSAGVSSDALRAAPKSIAVLPFADLSEAGDQAWFADGLAEEILNALARAPDLLVASRTAAFAYKGTGTPLTQIARELGVEHVLEGSVRRAGDRIRVTAQLIRAEDGFHVWSENYDREAEDVIALQEALALSIARALNTTMDPEALEDMLRVGTRSVAAYEAYLNGISLLAEAYARGQFGLLLESYEAFERARTIDPQFSDAHAQAAAFWRNQMSISRRGASLTDDSPEEQLALFEERIEAAIDTADTEVERFRNRLLSATVNMRIRDVIRLAREALALNPYDLFVLSELEDASLWAQDADAAQLLLELSNELRNQGAVWAGLHIRMGWRAPNPPPLADFIEWAIDRYDDRDLLYQSHRALLWQGEVERAAALVPRLRGERPQSFALVQARQACAEGRRSEVERILASLDPGLSPGDLASTQWHLLQLLGRHDEAHEALRPWASREVPLPVGAYLIYPDFDPSYFPFVEDILRRENIDRPPPAEIPFACPAADVVERQTIAVLPFRAMSSGPDDEYFADGLTEEILNALAQVPDLSVTSRTSSFFFKDKDLPIQDIAQQLGVKHVVEGSVRRSGDRLRVTAQLIRAGEDTHLWSETYDSTSADAIAVQEDIARQIAETLGVFLDERTLALMRSAGLRDVTAFIEYQKGRRLHEQAHGSENMLPLLAEGNEHLETALNIQPLFTPAWQFYSDYYTHLLVDHATGEGGLALSQQEIAEAYAAAQTAFTRAARSASNAGTRASAELDLAIFEGNGRAWRSLMEQVLPIESCETVIWHQLVGFVPEFATRFAELMDRLRACDPMTNRYAGMILSGYLWGGDPDRALNAVQVSAREEHAFHVNWRIRVLAALGQFDEAGNVAAIDSPDQRSRQQAEVLIAAAAGRESAARSGDAALASSGNDNRWLALQRAAWLGDHDRANALAAELDDEALGHLALMMTIYWCACGSPFDLEAAPNFAEIWQSAELPWPLESPIDFPLKDW